MKDGNTLLRIDAGKEGDRLVVKLHGPINERADFKGILDAVSSEGSSIGGLDFDLSGVTQINSAGVRSWMMFIGLLHSHTSFRFSLLNEIFVEQAGIVPEMFGKGKVEVISFEAPFYCPLCGDRTAKILRTEDLRLVEGKPQLPDYECEHDNEQLEFDGLEEEYFSFLLRTKRSA